MYSIVITALILNLLTLKIHSQQILFDFMPINEEDEEVNDQELSLYEEVLEDPLYEFRLCSNDFHHEKLIQELAWNYLVERATEIINIEELSDYEFIEIRILLEDFIEPVSSYISEVEVHYQKIHFFDINVCNNVSETDLEKIIAAYYYRGELMYDLENSNSHS